MICGAVFDTNEESRTRIRQWIIRYLMQASREMDMLWFTEAVSVEKIAKYGNRIHFALICLDDEAGAEVGQNLYRENPSCRICYYRTEPCDLIPLLSSRPISFYLWKQGEKAFTQTLDAITNELAKAKDLFQHETRRDLYLIPLRNILYVQSDLKYVVIHTVSGTEERLFAKLSQVENKLNSRFVRVHKSFIVNSDHVAFVDKKEHTVVLASGEHIPISEAQYEQAMLKFRTGENTDE